MLYDLDHAPSTTVRFTTNAALAADADWITAPLLADADVWWQGPGGSFLGKKPAKENFPAGDYLLRIRNWRLVTWFFFFSKNLTDVRIDDALFRTTALEVIYLQANAALAAEASGWRFPATTIALFVRDTLVYGDVSGWNMGTVQQLNAHNSKITGDVSKWNLASITTTVQFLVYNTLVTYGSSGALATITMNGSAGIRFDTCGWTLTMVDQALADCVTSGTTSNVLNLAGTNAAPTDGANNANRLELVNNRSWTVTVTA
jgi:hypothetical protein